MNSEPVEYDQLRQQAEVLPGNLIKAMAERDGPDEGGLTLSREHIITLNAYANHVFSLPSTQEAVTKWLGYSSIAEKELAPEQMGVLFRRLQTHGRSWSVLSDNSKRLGAELAASANGINTTGNSVLRILDEIKALGGRRDVWESVQFATPVTLDREDQRKVSSLVDYMEVLAEDVEIFARRVTSVRVETEQFRDEARFGLIPAVGQKTQLIERHQGSGSVDRLREELAQIDKDISDLNKEYDQYVKAAVSGLAAGPLGAVITGSIYGSKAEKVRKERNKRQKDRTAVSQRLRDAVALEGRLQELTSRMGELDARLRDVVTASSHLQSAWQTIGAYIDASIEQLARIESNQALARFAVYFERFLGQWAEIEKNARQMNRVFDDSAAIQ